MAEIKSAYERAMERFKDVEPDRHSMKTIEIKNNGKLLCAKVLQGEEVDITSALDKYKGDEYKWFKEGIGITILAQIGLPTTEQDIDSISVIKKIVAIIAPQATNAEQLLDQYQQLCEQYLENKTELTEQIKAQYMQMMEQRQYGQQNAQMEASMIQAVQQQLQKLDEQFEPAITQIKLNMRTICDLPAEDK